MKSKTGIFLSILFFIVGCGVMSNPNTVKGVEGETFVNDAGAVIFSKINTDSLTLADVDSLSIGGMSEDELTSYKVFETSTSTQKFLEDLNIWAQALRGKDSTTVKSWIKNIEDANINYQEKNLLFYPILRNEDCGLKEKIIVKENNASLIIQNGKTECDKTFVYHMLAYKVDKSIENIEVTAFDEVAVIIPNSAR